MDNVKYNEHIMIEWYRTVDLIYQDISHFIVVVLGVVLYYITVYMLEYYSIFSHYPASILALLYVINHVFFNASYYLYKEISNVSKDY